MYSSAVVIFPFELWYIWLCPLRL